MIESFELDFTSRSNLSQNRDKVQMLLTRIEGGLLVFSEKENRIQKIQLSDLDTSLLSIKDLPIQFNTLEAFKANKSFTRTKVRNCIHTLLLNKQLELVYQGKGRANSIYKKI